MRMTNVHLGRVRDLRKTLATHGCQAALFSEPLALRHLTGRVAEADRLLVMPGSVTWFEDARGKAFADKDIRVVPMTRGMFAAELKRLLKNIAVIAVEADTTTHSELKAFRSMTRSSEVRVKPVSGLLRDSRAIKSASELKDHARAAQIADEALAAVRGKAKLGMTETDVSWMLREEMFYRGAEDIAFETIVGFTEGAAVPHHRPRRDRKLKKSDHVLVDMGAKVNGAHSDMTRTFLPANASRKLRDAYNSVFRAQAAGLAEAREGAISGDVDKAARASLRADDNEKHFPYSTGHGVGLEIHEYPWATTGAKHELKAGMLLTVEPGVHVPGKLGIRIEDMIVVTANGCRILTKTLKEPEPFLVG